MKRLHSSRRREDHPRIPSHVRFVNAFAERSKNEKRKAIVQSQHHDSIAISSTKRCNKKCDKNCCSCKIAIKQRHFLNRQGEFRSLVIDVPGYYYFCSDIDVAPTIDGTSVIIVTASNVVIDFQSFYLNQTNPTYFIKVDGVRVKRNATNVTVVGDVAALGKVRNFAYNGIIVEGDTENITVKNMLITRDTQVPPILDSNTFVEWYSVGLSFVDYETPEEDIISEDKQTKNVTIDNVTCTNQDAGCNVSRATEVYITNCRFNSNSEIGIWLGNSVRTGLFQISAEPYVFNIFVSACTCDTNGFQSVGIVEPPFDGVTSYVKSPFAAETNRCININFTDCSFSNNFANIQPSDSIMKLDNNSPVRGVDDDACQQISFRQCVFNNNFSTVGSVEGIHYSGSIGNLRPNLNIYMEDCVSEGNNGKSEIFTTLVTGYTFVYARGIHLKNCTASGNFIQSDAPFEDDVLAGFYFEGFNVSTQQTNEDTVLHSCVSSRNITNSGNSYGFTITNEIGSSPGDANIQRGVALTDCTATGNVSSFDGDGAVGVGFDIRGRNNLNLRLETNQPGLGPFFLLRAVNSPPLTEPIVAPATLVLPLGTCLPLTPGSLTGLIAVVQYTGDCGSGTLTSNAFDAGAIAVIIVDDLTPTVAFGGSSEAFNGSISSVDGEQLIPALQVPGANITLTLIAEDEPSADLTENILLDHCVAIQNGHRTVQALSAGFRFVGTEFGGALRKVVAQNCVSLSNHGYGFVSQFLEDGVIKYCEADSNENTGFADFSVPSDSVYIGNIAIKNPVNYNINYPTPLQVSTGTAAFLPGPLAGVADRILNVAVS